VSLQLYATFIAATVILILIPGPNVALIVANSVAHGARYGLLTVARTSSAMIVQLSLAFIGHDDDARRAGQWLCGASLDRRRLISSTSASKPGARRKST
jgi:hypothetical protein